MGASNDALFPAPGFTVGSLQTGKQGIDAAVYFPVPPKVPDQKKEQKNKQQKD